MVPDASFLADAAETSTPLGEAAAELRRRIGRETLIAPTLIIWELGSSFRRHRTHSSYTIPKEAAQAIERLLDKVVFDSPDAMVLRRTLELAVRHSLSVFDASYLELAARDADTVLVTHDGPLRDAARRELGVDRALDTYAGLERFPAVAAE